MNDGSAVRPRLLNTESTAAVLLGAHDWTEAGLGRAPSFLRSGKAIAAYMYDKAGLGLDPSLILDLFDDPAAASDQLARVRETLDQLLRDRADDGRPVSDVLIYYIGHGTTDDAGHLSLLVRRSRKGMESESGIKAPDLARVLRVAAPRQRRCVILDCCFSEAAARAFIGMTGDLNQQVAATAAKDLRDDQPARGTMLLCSSPVGEISIGAPNAERTLFTGAVLEVLLRGEPGRGPLLSFAELRDAAYHRMVVSFGANAPRPALHQVDAAAGDLTRAPAFPNRALPEIAQHAPAEVVASVPPVAEVATPVESLPTPPVPEWKSGELDISTRVIDGTRPRSSTVQFFWVLYISIFFTCLLYSYGFLIKSWFPASNSALRVLGALIVAALIIRFINWTAAAIYRATRGPSWRWALVLPTLLVALGATVWGVLPTSEWAFLGPDVVSVDIRSASEQIGKMKAGAEGWLIVPEYETMCAEVEKLSKSLGDEIHNPSRGNYCGVGDAAINTLDKIHALIHEIYVLPGTTSNHNSSDTAGIDAIAQRDREQIVLFLRKGDMEVKYQIDQRQAFLKDFGPAAAAELQGLAQQSDDLAQVSTFLLNPGLYKRAKDQLQQAQQFYRDNFARIVAFHPNSVPDTMPRDLDISHSQSIGRSTETWATYGFLPMSFKKNLILLVSFTADLLAVGLTWWRLQQKGGPSSDRERSEGRKAVGGVAVLN